MMKTQQFFNIFQLIVNPPGKIRTKVETCILLLFVQCPVYQT